MATSLPQEDQWPAWRCDSERMHNEYFLDVLSGRGWFKGLGILATGQLGSASALWRRNRYQGIDRINIHLYTLMRLLQKAQRESPGEKGGGRVCKTE